MVEAICIALPRFDAAPRRFLLAVKRSCFNGAEIGKYRRKAEWADLLRISPSLPERIVMLEEQLLENERTFTSLYDCELARERRHVLSLILDRRFLRGVALGRPGLVQKISARAPAFDSEESLKRPAKWEMSLLRFVTRAAAKLSANSTLTAYALGSVQESPAATGFRFVELPLREVSLVRIDRPELEKLQMLLMRHPAVRERALIALNDTVEELQPGQYRFLHDGHWTLDPEAEGFRFVPPARKRVKLSSALLDAAQDALREGPLCYTTLLARIRNQHGISAGGSTGLLDRSAAALDQLVELGFLIIMPPWPIYEPRLEKRIEQFLRTLPEEPTVRRTADLLSELLALEEGFASAPQPEVSVSHLQDAYSRLLNTTAPLAGHKSPLTPRAHFFEEVLFEPSIGSDDAWGVFQIASAMVQEILQGAGMIARFAGLFNTRHDVLHTLAAWWRKHEPGRREIPLVEIVQRFDPIWKQFLHFHRIANEDAFNTFNPLQAPALALLREMREHIFAKSHELLRASPITDLLPVPQFEDLVNTLPRRYAPQLGLCAFVQPVDSDGKSWVLNHLFEGTGRYMSRLTPVLEEPVRQRFLSHLTARSVVHLDGEEADLLEVKYPWTNLVRAHPPQALKVLDLRGLHLDLPQERKVGLGDLTIEADLDAETFRLIDASGRRVLPVNLSSLSDAGLPNRLRMLLAFGPGEIRGAFPFPHSKGDENCRLFNRLTCGNLVIRRQRWTIGIESLRVDLETVSDARAYILIQDWRRRLGLPSAAFFTEETYQGSVKPQYVDFTAPSLCRLFILSLRKMATDTLTLEEALPSPRDFPFDSARDRRGFELLIDTFAIRSLSGSRSARMLPVDGESTSLRKERHNV